MKDFILTDLNYEDSVLKTIRMKTKTMQKIEDLSKKTNISLNRIINECIEYALDHLNEEEIDKVTE